MICMMIINSRDYLTRMLTDPTRLFQFCILYENNYYHNLLTLPIALVIILLIIINQTRKEYYRLNKEKFSIHIPIPYNPFSKTNRFDIMILCGIVSHEILEIIEEVFLKAAQMKLIAINGPLFDLIRQIGLVVIIGLRYYPVYSVIEISNTNILYYVLCSFYMWLDLFLKIFEHVVCFNIIPLIRLWKHFEQFKNKFHTRHQWKSLFTETTTMIPEYDDIYTEGFKGRFQRFRHRFSFRITRPTTTVIASTVQVREFILRAIAGFAKFFSRFIIE